MKNHRWPIIASLIPVPAMRELLSGSAPRAESFNPPGIRILWLIVAIPLAILSRPGAVLAEANGAVSDPQSLTYDGLERTYLRYVPPTYDETRPMPLLIALHGGGGTGEKMVELTVDLNRLADEEGFIVVYPDGVEKHWNDGRDIQARRASAEEIDDVGFIAALIEHLSESYAIDPGRIYAMGISNGGMMSYRLACELPETFAAIAAVVASMSEELAASCAPPQSTSVLVINGDEDPLVPWEGGTIRFWGQEFGEVVSTADTMAFWVAKNHCSPTPAITWEVDADPEDGTRVRSEVYGQCRDGTGVALYAIEGGGHTWPGGLQYLPEWVIGKTSRDINANEIIWQFFEEHPAPFPKTRPFPETGAWYNPDQPGSGINLEIQGGKLVGYYYGYDAEGLPEWQLFNGMLIRSELQGVQWELETPLLQFKNGNCTGCEYLPPEGPVEGATTRLEFQQRNYMRLTIGDDPSQFFVPIIYGSPGRRYFEEQTPYVFPEYGGPGGENLVDSFSPFVVIVKPNAIPPEQWNWESNIVHIAKGGVDQGGPNIGQLGYSMWRLDSPAEDIPIGTIDCEVEEASGQPGCTIMFMNNKYVMPIANMSDSRFFGEAEDGSTVEGYRLDYD